MREMLGTPQAPVGSVAWVAEEAWANSRGEASMLCSTARTDDAGQTVPLRSPRRTAARLHAIGKTSGVQDHLCWSAPEANQGHGMLAHSGAERLNRLRKIRRGNWLRETFPRWAIRQDCRSSAADGGHGWP